MGAGIEALEVWFRRVWIEADPEAVSDLMSEQVSVHGLEESELSGADEFLLFQRIIVAQFSDIRVSILQAVEEGEWVAARLNISAVHKSSGRAISGRSHVMCRFVDGKLVEGHNLVDLVQLFEQLGLLPERTVDQLLLGQRPRFTGRNQTGGSPES